MSGSLHGAEITSNARFCFSAMKYRVAATNRYSARPPFQIKPWKARRQQEATHASRFGSYGCSSNPRVCVRGNIAAMPFSSAASPGLSWRGPAGCHTTFGLISC